jgi:hypothetical protein
MENNNDLRASVSEKIMVGRISSLTFISALALT